MTSRRIAALVFPFVFVACVAQTETTDTTGEEIGSDEAAVKKVKPTECGVPSGDPCAAIPVVLAEIAVAVDDATLAAEADDAAHGLGAPPVPFTYPAAPGLSLAHLEQAELLVAAIQPYATSPVSNAAAYQVHSSAHLLWAQLWNAGHWSTISTAYHHSATSVSATDHITRARDFTNQLETLSLHCYREPYLP